jgi:hypothetical protein
MKWIAYAVNPIDFHWEHLQTVQTVAAKLAEGEADEVVTGEHGASGGLVSGFLSALDTAKELARKKGWEGDFRPGHEPRVFWLPGENEFHYAFVWKQENNGDTFIVSPLALPWVE